MSNTGMFDNDEWKFECQRDEKAAKELEVIQEIRNNWTEWGNKRLMPGDSAQAKSYNEQIANFCNSQANTEIAKLEGRYNGKD